MRPRSSGRSTAWSRTSKPARCPRNRIYNRHACPGLDPAACRFGSWLTPSAQPPPADFSRFAKKACSYSECGRTADKEEEPERVERGEAMGAAGLPPDGSGRPAPGELVAPDGPR